MPSPWSGPSPASGAAQAWCVGNHDVGEAFCAVLGTGHLNASGEDVGRSAPSVSGVCAAASAVGGLRVVTLDNLVPGEVLGRLGTEQLDWLRRVLARPAPAGTVLVLHHPPISVSPQWAGEPAGPDRTRGRRVRLGRASGPVRA